MNYIMYKTHGNYVALSHYNTLRSILKGRKIRFIPVDNTAELYLFINLSKYQNADKTKVSLFPNLMYTVHGIEKLSH
jgi:hypothetical protein